jgi:hypothetical protein
MTDQKFKPIFIPKNFLASSGFSDWQKDGFNGTPPIEGISALLWLRFWMTEGTAASKESPPAEYEKDFLIIRDVIGGALNECAGKLTHRLTPFHLRRAIIDAEHRLGELGIPKKLWTGMRVHLDASEYKASSYKYSYKCVGATLELKSSGWAITSIHRVTAWPGNGRATRVVPGSEEQREAWRVAAAASVDAMERGI